MSLKSPYRCRQSAEEPAECLNIGPYVINSHEAVGLEEEMIIYAAQMEPAKWKNMKNRIFRDADLSSFLFFFFFPSHTN